MRTKRVTLLLAALCGVAALSYGAPAGAGGGGSKKPIQIETHGVFTGPTSSAGTFVLSGALDDSGTYVDTFRLDGDVIHVVKTLTGSRGTVTLKAKGVVRPTSPTTVTFVGGRWRITDGTGAYARLEGGGRPGATGSADFAAGTVAVVHEGKVRR